MTGDMYECEKSQIRPQGIGQEHGYYNELPKWKIDMERNSSINQMDNLQDYKLHAGGMI